MEFRELRSLCVLAESKSLSATARVVHLSPAAIHKQIKHLEEELQVALYERKEGRLRLTPAAELLLPYLRDILGQYESAISALEEWRGLRRGLVRIGAGPSLATYVLPNILSSFHAEFPRVDFDVQTGNTHQLIDSLRAGELDLAIVVAPEAMEEPSLEIVTERQTEVTLVTAMKIAPKRGSLASLKRYPFILFRKASRIDRLIERYCATYGVSFDSVMRFDNAESLKSMLMHSSAIAMLPRYTVEDDIREGRLRQIRQREPTLFMKVHMLSRRGGYQPPAVQAFIQLIKLTTKI